jgi:hypothetical protein
MRDSKGWNANCQSVTVPIVVAMANANPQMEFAFARQDGREKIVAKENARDGDVRRSMEFALRENVFANRDGQAKIVGKKCWKE